MARRLQPPYPPPLLPPARYQVEPHLRYDFPTPRRPRLQTWRTRWRLWRRRFRWWQARQGQRLLDRLLGVPHQQPRNPGSRETDALRALLTGLLLIVLFQMGLLLLVSR